MLLLSCFILFGCTKKENNTPNKSNNLEEKVDLDIVTTKDTIVFKSNDNIYTTFYYNEDSLQKITSTSIFNTEEEAKSAEELFKGEDFKKMYGNIKRDGKTVTFDYISDYFKFYEKLNKSDLIKAMEESGYSVEEQKKG